MTQSPRPGRPSAWRSSLAALRPPPLRRERLVAALITLVVASAGGLALYAVSAPAAFLTGSALAASLAVLLRVPLHVPNPVRDASFAMMGMMMGTGVTPEGLTDMTRLPLALAGLVLVIVGATLASYWVLRRMGNYDSLDAYLASVPGHFSLVMALAVSVEAHVEKVILPQVLRLFILIVLVPMLLGGPESATFRAATPDDYGPASVALTVAVAFLSAVGATLLRIPAGMLIGPMVASTILSGTVLMQIAVPVWMGAAAFIVLGAIIGARFRAIRREGLRRMLAAALASFVAAAVVAVAVSVAVAFLIGESVAVMFLGYAPGGLDAMIALSFLLGFDVALVALLHTGRMILLGFGAPLALPWFERRRARQVPAALDDPPEGVPR